jgi:hypothetical protein
MHVPNPVLWLPLAVLAPAALGVTLPGDDTVPTKQHVWSQAELERVSDKIKGQIEALRGQEFKHAVRVELQDKDGLIAYMKKRQDEFEPEAQRVATEELAKLLGLVPADLDLQSKLRSVIEAQVGGFYDPAADAFYLMESFTGDLAQIILAHELTHALDDQWYDLDGGIEELAGSTDALEAFRAVIEGSATYAMQAWMLKHGLELDRRALLESQDLTTGGLDDAPAFIWKPLIAAYMQGLAFLMKGDRLDVEGYLEQAFENPPRSMEQVLHPDKYWVEEERDEPRAVRFDVGALPEGWEELHQDTLGELYMALMTAPAKERGGLDASNPMALLAMKYTNDAATGWDGDRVVLLGKGAARAARLVSVWDTPEDAQEFAAALQATFDALDDQGFEVAPRRSVRLTDEATVVVDVQQGEDAVGLDPAWTVAE